MTIEPWSFLNISAYPELKEDHFGAKKKFKKLINKDFRAFFLKTVFIFSRPQFSKIWISETGYGSRLIPRYFRKKNGRFNPKNELTAAILVIFEKIGKGVPFGKK